nr:Ig-like domain-containing protein [Motilibacter deserti]
MPPTSPGPAAATPPPSPAPTSLASSVPAPGAPVPAPATPAPVPGAPAGATATPGPTTTPASTAADPVDTASRARRAAANGAGAAAAYATAPTTRPDSLKVASGERTAVANVLANDALHGVDYPVMLAAEPAHGTAEVLTDGRVRYTADEGYRGTDELTYALVGPDGDPAVAALSIDVAGPAAAAPATLPRTGADVKVLAGAAIALLASGSALCALARRRRTLA